MMKRATVIGWLVDEGEKAGLLARFRPRYERVVAHHVTLKPNAAADETAPPVGQAMVVGEADDGRGVQALVVSLDGTTRRPDGSVYHITWSLGPGRRPVESNAVIAKHGWSAIDPTPISLVPSRF